MNKKILITNHAQMRMFERNIPLDKVYEVISKGEMIEEYLDDFPCQSVLIYGNIDLIDYHVVVGNCSEFISIITIYLPDEINWIDKRFRKDDNI